MVQIHACEPPGDILVFLTGEEEIEDACRKVTKEIQQMGDKVRYGNKRSRFLDRLTGYLGILDNGI